ncbi:MAG: hypothetical protein KTR22_13025 [Flavobacteriaceae bacterium]|nr:hypothetical protein [Flavobacteriaceae bacterium]
MKKFKNTQPLGIISYILSYMTLILCFLISEWETILFGISWVLGIMSFISNIILSVQLNRPKLFSTLLIISGISWFFLPITLMSLYSWPILFTFLILVPLLHIEYQTKWEQIQIEHKKQTL